MERIGRRGGSDAAAISASASDPQLFSVVVERHFVEIHRYLAKRVGPDADDLAAETFVVAFKARHRYDSDRPDARPWLYGIAANIVRHHRRTEARRLAWLVRLRTTGDRPGDDSVAADERVDARQELARLTQAFAGLDVEHRDALYLVAVAGLSYDEAAEALGWPVGTVHSRVARARARLRDLMGAHGQEGDGGNTAEKSRSELARGRHTS